MNTENTSGLLDELERLRTLLRVEPSEQTKEELIPVLTDIVEEQTASEIGPPETQTAVSAEFEIAEINAGNDSTSQIRHQLRQQGKAIIQNIIAEERVRLETRLNRELNSYLEQLLDTLQPDTEAPASSWEEPSV